MSDTIQTMLAPEAVVDELRTMRAQIAEVKPLTNEQRRLLKQRTRMSNPVLQASINALGASDNVSLAVGQPPAEVRQLHEECNRWTAVEDELRTLLNGIAGANLIRRQRVELAAAQAFVISKELVRDPAHAVLVPHVQEIQRLKSAARRKKGTQPTPSPIPSSPAPAPKALQPEETSGSSEA